MRTMRRWMIPLVLGLFLFAVPVSAQRDSLNRVRYLASNLERAADDLYRVAAWSSHHYDREESYAIQQVRAFVGNTDHFDRSIDHPYVSTRHVASRWRQVEASWRDVTRSIDELHPTRDVRRRIAQVDNLMDRLDWAVDGLDDHGRRYRRHRDRSIDIVIPVPPIPRPPH